MKRTLFLFLFAAVAVMTAMAEEYIKVSNREMSFTESWTKSYNYFNDASSGSVSWDAANRKLTLNKFSLWRGFEVGAGTNVKTCIEVYSTKSVTIEVVGFNKIVNFKGQTLALHGNTTFTGNGTLKLGNNDDKKPGMDLLEENLDITVNGPTLQFECKNGGIRGKNNTGTLYVKAGEVMTLSNGKLVTGLANISFAYGMGVKNPHGAWFSRDKHCIVDLNGKEITNPKIELDTIKYYGFRICGYEITENNYDNLNRIIDVRSGKIMYDPVNNWLGLNNATIHNNTDVPTIMNHSNENLTIYLDGHNKFTFESTLERQALNLKENTYIENTEYGGASMEVVPDFAGIYVANGKKLNLRGVTLDVPYIAGGGASSELILGTGVEITARGGGSKGTVRQLRVAHYLGDYGQSIAVKSNRDNPRFIWNNPKSYGLSGVYQDKSYLATGEVVLSTKGNLTWFPLYICGYQVNILNCSNPVNEFVESGRLYYDNENRRLWMYDANINYYEKRDKAAISWQPGSTTGMSIHLKGNNTIKSDYAPAINATYNIGICRGYSITDDVSLTLTGKMAKINAVKQLTFTDVANATIPEIEAGLLKVHNTKLNVTKKQESDKAEITFAMVVSTPEAPAYYDEGYKELVVVNKGPVTIVPASSVKEYPILFCGEQVTSANAACVMNRYVKRGSLSIEQVGSQDKYSIKMDDFGMVYDSSAPMFYFNSSTTEYNIYLYNKSIFMPLISTLDRIGKFIDGYAKQIHIRRGTVTGTPRLWVLGSKTTNAGAIAVPENCKLYIDSWGSEEPYDIGVPRIYGHGTSSEFIVNNPYLIVTGNSQGSVTDVKCLMGSNVDLDYNPESPYEIGTNGIVQYGSTYTGQVEFIKKGEGYVKVTNVGLDKEELTLTRKGQTEKLTATVSPSNATEPTIKWYSTNDSVATVDQNGRVTALTKGTARIIAQSANTVSATCNVTVAIPDPTGITLSETDVLIDSESIGGFYLTANLTPSNAETKYTWESSDSTLVSVLRTSGQTALVRRVGDEGTATITVKTANGLSASCEVTVHYPITPMFVEFEQRVYTLTEAGQQLKLEPIVTPDNCEKLSFTWYTSSDAISLSNDGTVTARRNGSAVVECWACYDGQKWAPGEVRINVEIPPTPVIATGLKLKAAHSIFHSLGEAFIITPVFTPENVTNQELAWDTTDASVATVDEDGFVTVVGWGDCYITATTTDGSDIKATYSVTAIDPSTIPDPIYATGIRLDENEVTLMRGEQAYIGVTIEPADYNQSVMIEPMEGDVSIAQVDAQWDWNTNRICIYIRTEEWSEMSGDLKVRVRPNMVDWDKLNEMGIWMEPADTLTIHVLAPIIFAEASPEDINITYHVTDIKDKTCEVYTQPRPGMTMIDPLDPDLIPAVSTTATGKLTVPARANGYWVTHVMPCAFNRCSGLTEIEFSEGIETIGDYACYSALYSLERVTLPSTIKELGQYCFSANPSDYATSEDPSGRNFIREVNIKSFTPPTGQNGSDINWTGAFQSVAADAVLFVPTGALANYNVQPWTNWFSRIEEKAFFEDYDAIASPKSSPEGKDFNWFDLSGRRISKPTKAGLYIRNGKKIVVK